MNGVQVGLAGHDRSPGGPSQAAHEGVGRWAGEHLTPSIDGHLIPRGQLSGHLMLAPVGTGI